MSDSIFRTTFFALSLGLSVVGVQAASSATSSASESATSSASSASDSITGSSNSSSRTGGMAAGNYQLTQVAEVSGRPGMLRMTLARLGDAVVTQQVEVSLPREAFDKGSLAIGGVIAVREKSYGLELANGRRNKPSFSCWWTSGIRS